MISRGGAWLCAAACLAALPGFALDFTLDLDTGGHRGAIRALSVSADGQMLASGSDDKTVRIWDLDSAQSVITLRGQIGPGSEGVVNAVALAPDGGSVAVGGYFAPHASIGQRFGDIRIFDVQSGQITQVLRGLEFPVETLSYAPERDELAASGQGGKVARWRAPFRPEATEALEGFDTEARRVRALAHAQGGTRLIAATLDYGLRVWDTESGALVMMALEDVALTALSVAPDGTQFAVAGADGRVELRDATDGELLSALPPRPFRPDALVLTEGLLIVSCGHGCGTEHRSEVWDLTTGAMITTHREHDAAITVAAHIPGADEILTAGGRHNAILRWDAGTGATRAQKVGLGEAVSGVGIAQDGMRLGWGHADPCPARNICPEELVALTMFHDLPGGPRGFDGSEPRAATPQDVTQLRRAQMQAGGLSLSLATTRRSAFEGDLLRIEGTDVELRRSGGDGYFHSAASVLPEAGLVVSGGANGILTAHELNGGFAQEFVGHTGTVLALATSETAGLMISGSADQTMRLWNLASGNSILSGFAAGEHWIWWTEEGYYQSSPEADAIVGWHINQGPDKAARYIRARQLRRHLHNPAVIRQALILRDSAEAAQVLMGDTLGLAALLEHQPPDFDLRIAEEIPAPAGQVAIELTGVSAEDLADWGIAVMVNNRRIRPEPLIRADLAGRFVYLVALEEGENDIRVQSRDGFDNITERGARRLMSRAAAVPRGRLHVAVIGIDSYPDLPPEACGGRSCDLDFAVADAAAFLTTVADRVAPLHEPGEMLVMLSAESLARRPEEAEALRALIGERDILEPTRGDILDELEDFFAQAAPDDTTYLFLAGHGGNIEDGYFLFPADARARGAEFRRGSLVDWRDLQDLIDAAYGKRLLFIDTCHAANAVNPRFRKDSADSRLIGFTATLEDDVALERAELGHGVFTFALLEGLRGRADPEGSGVRLLGLTDYVDTQVRRLSNGKQIPVYHLPSTTNFVLTRP
ncbi:MAG: hypothetical protein ACK4NW_07080 [Roseinatronobacter sp.]